MNVVPGGLVTAHWGMPQLIQVVIRCTSWALTPPPGGIEPSCSFVEIREESPCTPL